MTTGEITKLTGFSRAYVNRFFKELREEGKITLLGQANRAHYFLTDKKRLAAARAQIVSFRNKFVNKNLSEDVVLSEIKRKTSIFNLPTEVETVADYAFTEMLNNAIEHSGSKTIEVIAEKNKGLIKCAISDKGVGAFQNIMKKRGLKNELEAIQDLLKGKQTTAPLAHSGEGIFFTSKVCDTLIIESGRKKLIFNQRLQDVFINDIKMRKGTRVVFTISLGSKIKLADVFQQYADSSYQFNKTKVNIVLYKNKESYISRSQARRLLVGLEKFKEIALDFQRVDTVGQGFTDEVFRVWQNKYPQIKIDAVNTNQNVDFMIGRARGNG